MRLCPSLFQRHRRIAYSSPPLAACHVFRSSGTQVTGITFLAKFSGRNDAQTHDGINAARLGDLWWTQRRYLVALQETMTPLKIVRGAGHRNWTVTDLAFDEIPRYLFTPSETLPAANLTPSQTDGRIDLTASAATFHDGLTGTATAGGTNTITLPSSAVATDGIYNGSKITLTGGTGSVRQSSSKTMSDLRGSRQSPRTGQRNQTRRLHLRSSHVGQKIFDNDSGIGQAHCRF